MVGTNNEVRSIAFDEDDVLYVGGNFDNAGAKEANRIATFDGDTWGTLGSGTSGFVQAIEVTEASVYVGGNFAIAGDQTVNRVARWDRGRQPMAESRRRMVSGNVNALEYDGTHLYVGGNFETATTSQNQSYLVKNVARWSPQNQWEALGTAKEVGTDTQINALFLSEGGASLYAGGNFERAGASDAAAIARWSNEAASLLIADGAVYELEPQHAPGNRLDVRGVSTANRTLVDMFRRNGNANQQWKFISQGGDIYEIEPQHAPGKRLDVAGARTATNTRIHIYDRHGKDNQRWKALPVGDGLYRFEPQNAPGKRLDIESVNGVPRALSRTLDAGNSQRWKLIAVPSSTQVAADDENTTLEVDAYPNPTADVLYLRGNQDLSDATVQVSDLFGRVLSASTAVAQQAGGKQLDLATASWRPGVYLITIRNKQGREGEASGKAVTE